MEGKRRRRLGMARTADPRRDEEDANIRKEGRTQTRPSPCRVPRVPCGWHGTQKRRGEGSAKVEKLDKEQ